MSLVFLDTNVLLRHLLQDHPEQSPKATAFLAHVESGDVRARTSDTVVFETVFTLQRHYGVPREEIRDALLPLIELPALVLPGKRRLRKVFGLYVEHGLPFADAYHAALMERLGLDEIATFDDHFDRVHGIRRSSCLLQDSGPAET
ncbi:MAG: PIN domain-containing protein [Acidobacteria bacterium]|nr:PIN domain-containing protein [Acidobacteriota bacterium]